MVKFIDGVKQGAGFFFFVGIFVFGIYLVRAWNGLQATDGDVLTAEKWNQLVSSNSSTPRGFIGAFNGTVCPGGWNPADGIDDPAVGGGTNPIDARGQFLRGLNSFDGGTNIRSDGKQDTDGVGRAIGSYQGDELKGHTHTIYYYETSDGSSDANWYFDSSTSSQGIKYQTTSSFGGTETRSKNVGVVYCIKE
ncbi:MAG: hypothetical protein V3575_03380 [Candidatus Absconditabacteria bacterium]